MSAPLPVVPDPSLGPPPAPQAVAASRPARTPQPSTTPAPATSLAVDPTSGAPAEPAAHPCPWCSAVLPEGEADRCPACGANLIYGSAQELPGLTEVARPGGLARNSDPPRLNRLLSWISGEYDDEPTPAPGEAEPLEALALPSRDVRREMLRLQLTAEGMVVSESGDIEPGPELQAAMAAAQAGDAAAEAPPAAESAESAEAPPAAESAGDVADATTPDTEIRKAS